ncbi:hypothetical protein [Caballeronia ptereochthonis]|uniref:Peptidase S8/S53 domain-containing protein n=1 Tax=Caballeronia ptereochthonis TaxID=1777144 RepID=A0A158DEF1_9BURK|nr:hypothetical protein [Caballeronia ptereochthonis]SAK92969.1 hypothetical protein AWB83_05377 [Caballeronia ptereochthonis]
MSPHWETRAASDGFGPVAQQALASVTRLDPYIVWANITRYRDLGGMPRGRIPIIIEMKQGGDTARQFAHAIERNGWRDWIWMSALYRDPPPVLEATRFCTAHVTRAFFAHLHTELAGRFERFTEALAIASRGDARVRPMRFDRAPLAPAPMHPEVGRVIVGVCEDGLSFLHRRYAEDAFGTSTRFQCFWNQNDAANSATGLGYGSELMKARIDAMLSDAASTDVSRAAGDARIHRLADHGAAAAARAGRYPSSALPGAGEHDRPLPMIGVQLRRRHRIMRDAFGPSPDAGVLDAVRYIVQRAQHTGGAECHALVSMNTGNAAWRQDGSSLIESALGELMDTGACSIVLPSANDDPSRCRGELTIADRAALRWPVRADCASPSLAEIWLSSDGAEPSVDVQIVPPDGVESAWLTLGEIGTYTRGGDALCTVVHLGRGARGDGHMILVALAPTAARGRTRRASAGQWLIRLRNNADASVTAHTWMQCDESSDDTPLAAPSHSRGGGTWLAQPRE